MMVMVSTSKSGLLLKSKIICDGQMFRLLCSIEDSPPYRYGVFRNLDHALRGMTMFHLDRKSYAY